jgi:glycosyltransferase involved in cell wall biosynthesis
MMPTTTASKNDKHRKVIAYMAASAGDWGGASRYLFVTLKLLDKTRFAPLVLLPSEGPGIEALEAMGVRWHIWGPVREPRGWLRFGADVRDAMRLFRQYRVSVLHFNFRYWRPAEIIAAQLLRVPVISHCHLVNREPSPFIARSSLIIANSRYTLQHSLPKDVPMQVIYCSTDLARYDSARDIRPELGIGAEEVVVSLVGQIREIKGVDLFIRLAHRLKNTGARFLIAGECRDPAKFKGSYTEARLREEIGGNEQIRYVGYRSDVESIYRASDIIVTPSRWDEPFGLINIEAGASRKPVVATRVGGIPEAITHGENGLLAERDDLETLVAHVRLLIENRDLRQQMGERGRRIVEERFTSAPVRELEAIYDSIRPTGSLL